MIKKYFEEILSKVNSNARVKKIVSINATVFFIGWLAIMLYIADTPPPPGFIIVVLALSVLAFFLYIYCASFIPRMISGEKYLFRRNLLKWLIGGIILGFLLTLCPGGEPSMQGKITIYDKLILLGVVTFLSAINGIGFYIFNVVLVKEVK